LHAPIILTVQFDEQADCFFQELRKRHFPPEINFVGAHLTLFHNLPGAEEDAILREVARAATETAPFDVAVAGLMKLGRGVALRLESDELLALRARLAAAFDKWLIKQDRQKFRPHVTIQNKAAPHVAAALFEHLAATLPSFTATAEGIQIWRYQGGPWSALAAIPFQKPPTRASAAT
jgi:2'-5' RNA ligase